MKRMVLKLVMVLVVVVVTLLATGVWLFWKRPITVEAWSSRRTLARAGLTMEAVETKSGDILVWQGGTGAPMVLLHGAGDQAGVWAGVVPQLLKGHRLLIPDQPGHWRSPPHDGPLSIEVVYDGLVALMESCCGEEPAILVGSSMGAWVAMLYAHEHPSRVSRVVAVNGGAIKQEEPQVNLFPSNRDEARQTMAGLTGPSYPEIPGFVLDDIVRHARVGAASRLAQTAAEMETFLLDGRLHELVVPVVLVWGDADRLLPLTYARQMLDQLPEARLLPIHGCGHVPPRECPGACNQALAAALSDGSDADYSRQAIEVAPEPLP